MVPDGADRAIIFDKTVNKQALYETGDAVQGAVVKEILRGKVILVYNGRDEMLDMSEAAKVRPAYAVPVAKTGVVRGADGKQPVNRPAVSTRKHTQAGYHQAKSSSSVPVNQERISERDNNYGNEGEL